MNSSTRVRLVCVIAIALACAASLDAQTRTSTQARPGVTQAQGQGQFKGIFEPVSFTEDIDLTQVVFVTADVGWAAGEHGTIIHTTDGGKTWDAQLGGDPADKADNIRVLHFLDERRGWAIQGLKTLHTRDGESWEEIGTAPQNVESMAFTSPRIGFVGGNVGHSVSGPQTIYRTTDGGRSWKPVWNCQAKVSVGGLNRNISCVIGKIYFPTPRIGYAAIRSGCIGYGCGGPSLIAKTTDGGSTWQIMNGPGVFEQDEVDGLFFTDENTGFARLTSKKLHMTTDGGATWRGIVASPGKDIQFADPSVGWGIELGWSDLRLAFTTDGGRRWSSREMKMPAVTRAFSLPRRDRGYVVGDHGMIFRYRVVPSSAPMGPNVVAAPAMPAFESPVDEQVAQLETVLKDLSTELEAFTPPSSGGVTPAGTPINADSVATADSTAAWNEPFEAPLPPASGFTSNCCRKSFSRLELTLGLLAPSLQDFIAKYRNLNLLLAAVRMGTELPGEYRNLKGGLRTFRSAQDKESAKAALADVIAALSALKQTTAVSMQQQLPPVPGSGMDGAPGPAFSAASAAPTPEARTPEAKAAAKSPAKSETKDAVKDAAKDAAKKGLGGLLRRKP